MARERKKLPRFRSEREERRFWATHDSTDYLDWEKAQPAVFSNLRASARSISIRLPESLLAEIRTLANKLDVPYQSLIKILLAERLDERRGATRGGRKRPGKVGSGKHGVAGC